MRRTLMAVLMVVSWAAPVVRALPPDEARKIYQSVSPSLVVVQYTWDSEFGRRELLGQGVVVGKEGLVMASLAVFPLQIADEQMKEFKIILPGDDEKEFDAVFLGRDERSDLAFLKTREPQQWQAIQFEDAPVDVGDPIASVGLLPKNAGYKAYYAEAAVQAVLRGPVPHVLVSPSGLASVGSPVFSAEGKAIGLVSFQQNQTQWLAASGAGIPQSITSPPRYFVPARDFMMSLRDLPDGKPLSIPWIGAQLSGLNKEVAEYYGLKGTPVAQIGEVIPDSPAQKAGLRPGDKIVKVNGQALERGDEPMETPMIFLRKIRRMKNGEAIKLTVLREKGRPTIETTLVLEEQPTPAHVVRRFYAEDLGMSMREVVFADTYTKRVSRDTKGVVASFVRESSSAATAGLRLGDLVTHLNKNPVTNLDGFRKQYAEFRAKYPKDVVVLLVVREQRTEVIKIEPPQ